MCSILCCNNLTTFCINLKVDCTLFGECNSTYFNLCTCFAISNSTVFKIEAVSVRIFGIGDNIDIISTGNFISIACIHKLNFSRYKFVNLLSVTVKYNVIYIFGTCRSKLNCYFACKIINNIYAVNKLG